MKLSDLIAQFRTDCDDKVKPYLFGDDDITLWLNEAEEEAALRANLLFEATDPTICTIPVTAEQTTYALDERVFMVMRASFVAEDSDDVCVLDVRGRLTADLARRSRRTETDKPRAVLVDDTTLELDCPPESAGVLSIEVYRAPLEAMVKDTDSPEIGRVNHRFLTKWAEYRAYCRPDTETFDQQRAERALAAFTAHFGIRPDASTRRDHQADAPTHNTAYY